MLDLPDVRRAVVVNATRNRAVALALAAPLEGRVVVRDTTGRVVAEGARRLAAGLHRIEVPAAGMLEVSR